MMVVGDKTQGINNIGRLLSLLLNVFFSRESDSRDSIVLDGCGYVKSQVWLCSKRCGYVKVGVVMLKKVWLCCHQNLNTPFQS